MKWMLLAFMVSTQDPIELQKSQIMITYPTEDVCRMALEEVKAQDPKAICIPKGEDKQTEMFDQFFKMVDKLQAMEQNKGLDNDPK